MKVYDISKFFKKACMKGLSELDVSKSINLTTLAQLRDCNAFELYNYDADEIFKNKVKSFEESCIKNNGGATAKLCVFFDIDFDLLIKLLSVLNLNITFLYIPCDVPINDPFCSSWVNKFTWTIELLANKEYDINFLNVFVCIIDEKIRKIFIDNILLSNIQNLNFEIPSSIFKLMHNFYFIESLLKSENANKSNVERIIINISEYMLLTKVEKTNLLEHIKNLVDFENFSINLEIYVENLIETELVRPICEEIAAITGKNYNKKFRQRNIKNAANVVNCDAQNFSSNTFRM